MANATGDGAHVNQCNPVYDHVTFDSCLQTCFFRNQPTMIEVDDIDTMTSTIFRNALWAAVNTGQPFVPVYINSLGGDLYAVLEMLDALRSAPIKVVTVCTGSAMSCGALLFAAGHERWIVPHGRVMIHDSWSMSAMGEKTTDKKADTDHLLRLTKELDWGMSQDIGKPHDFIGNILKRNMNANVYLNAEECIDLNIATHIGLPRFKAHVGLTYSLEPLAYPKRGSLPPLKRSARVTCEDGEPLPKRRARQDSSDEEEKGEGGA